MKTHCNGEDWSEEHRLTTGALGGGISGSGPSIFMLSKEEATAKNVEIVMQKIYQQLGIDYKTYVTTISSSGVKIYNSDIK